MGRGRALIRTLRSHLKICEQNEKGETDNLVPPTLEYRVSGGMLHPLVYYMVYKRFFFNNN